MCKVQTSHTKNKVVFKLVEVGLKHNEIKGFASKINCGEFLTFILSLDFFMIL